MAEKEFDDAVDQKEKESENGEHHHHHHHHHSKRRSKGKTSIKRFWKKNKFLLLNLAIALVAVVSLVAIVLLGERKSNARDTGIDRAQTSSGVQVTPSAIRIEIPLFSGEQQLISGKARSFSTRDLSVPVSQVIRRYRESGERLDLGLPVRLNYEVLGLPSDCSVLSAKVEVATDLTFSDARVFALSAEQNSVDVYHLYVNTQYYYRISLNLSDKSTTAIQGSFRTANTPRLLYIEGVVNVRDIGGWETVDGKIVRQGLLYRGSELDGAYEAGYHITEKGIEDMLMVLGVRTEMDLRSPDDSDKLADVLGRSVERIVYDAPMYGQIFSQPDTMRRIFEDLADPSKYPVYLHCTYGMDRTGTVCYLLEALLGMSPDDLMHEYELSAMYHGMVSEEAMTGFVAMIEKMEGNTVREKVENYLLSIGITEEQIHQIRSIFLEQ